MGSNGNDNGPTLVVRGMKGFFTGEERELAVGEEIVVGRSRSADLSLRAARRFVQRDDQEQIMKTEAFLSVSRKHVKIHYLHPGLVEAAAQALQVLVEEGRKLGGKETTQRGGDTLRKSTNGDHDRSFTEECRVRD